MDSDHDKELAGLLAEGQNGNQEAYEKFLLGASMILRGFLSRRMGDIEMVEDVLQETLLAVHRARHTHISGRPVGPWLYAICAHRMTDYFRRCRRVERMEVSAPGNLDDLHATHEGEAVNERGHRVREALQRLPEKQRKVIELLKIQDLSVNEVAAQTGMSESAVKVTAFRGYETIRRIFGVKGK